MPTINAKIRKYTIQTIVIWEMNLANRYSQRLTDLLSNESAISPISPEIEAEEITTAIIVPKKTKNVKRKLIASKLLFPIVNNKPINKTIMIHVICR
jgi:hypothetical protein